ncbi:MAG: HAMP domain-containing histidine kinase [Solirubrobacterales bacterium]|nr:HAMP domain-containing histidine kinase [Solirubrobacterales bacterium]
MTSAALITGWVAATVAASLAILARRLLSGRMEALARLCHELRGPLTAARLGLELEADAGALSSPRLRAIELELGRAELALEDLAELHSGRGAPDSFEEVDLDGLVSDSIEAWRPSAVAEGIELGGGWSRGPARLWGDRLRLAQAIGNLLANAIEHGGGPVEIRGACEGARVRVEVLDRGPGLPAPVAELSRRARGGRGTRGRGLAIASAVAKAHGGRLAAAPTEQGARLVLDLPARRLG